jgi:hypothetical protein
MKTADQNVDDNFTRVKEESVKVSQATLFEDSGLRSHTAMHVGSEINDEDRYYKEFKLEPEIYHYANDKFVIKYASHSHVEDIFVENSKLDFFRIQSNKITVNLPNEIDLKQLDVIFWKDKIYFMISIKEQETDDPILTLLNKEGEVFMFERLCTV